MFYVVFDTSDFRISKEAYILNDSIITWQVGLHFWVRDGLRIVGNDLDVDGDDRKDIILTNSEWNFGYPYVHIYLRRSGGYNLFNFRFADIIDSFCTDGIWVGDINADGKVDLIVGTMSNRSPRTDALPTFIYYGYPFKPSNVDTLLPASNENSFVADLNNDGYLDIITGIFRHYNFVDLVVCSWVYWGGPYGWDDDHKTCLMGAGTHPVFAADMNSDGFLDVYIGSLYYHYARDSLPIHPPRIYFNTGYGFDTTRYLSIYFDGPPYDTVGSYGGTAADFNKDGYLDLLSCAYRRGFIMWGPNFSYTDKTEFNLEDCRIAVAADINGDGWVDVIFGEKAPRSNYRNGRVRIYFNNSGTFSEMNKIDIPSSSTYGVLPMDYNDDGLIDLLVSRKEEDSSSLYFNLGPPYYFDTTYKINFYTVKASRNLSVQIFGNIYDRKNRFFLLLPTKYLPGGDNRIRNVRIYGNIPQCCSLEVYMRVHKSGGWTDFRNVNVYGEIRDTLFMYSDSVQILLEVYTNYAGTSRFKLDSIKVGVEMINQELGIGEKDIDRKAVEMYDVSGKRVLNTKKRGVYFIKTGKGWMKYIKM